MPIKPNDDLKSIYEGPISVILLLIQNRSHLNSYICPKFKEIKDNNSITHNILNLLYNLSYKDDMQRIIHELHKCHPEEAAALDSALLRSQSLSAYNRLRSIDYINYILQAEHNVLLAINPLVEHTCSAQKLMGWYLEERTQHELRKVNPVAHLEREEQAKLYGMFSSAEEFSSYLFEHGIGENTANYVNTYPYAEDPKKCCTERLCFSLPDLSCITEGTKALLFCFNREPEISTQPIAHQNVRNNRCGIM